jgi:hypothetical protein
MTISARAKTKKKQKSKATTFRLNDLRIHRTTDEFGFGELKNVYYKGRKIKRHASSARDIYKIGNVIVKIESDDKFQTNGEIRFYRRLHRQKTSKQDSKYFPKLIDYDAKKGIIVQEFIPFRKGRRSQEHRAIITRLINKYQIHSDVWPEESHNWAINKNTNLPVIYDLGYS